MRKWISCSDRLPNENEWVLGFIRNFNDGSDAPKMCVVKLEKGISVKERKALYHCEDERAKIIFRCDEWGNNKLPYGWVTWGINYYFGQEVIAWMPLPEPEPNEE